jgi:hypothetical protein
VQTSRRSRASGGKKQPEDPSGEQLDVNMIGFHFGGQPRYPCLFGVNAGCWPGHVKRPPDKVLGERIPTEPCVFCGRPIPAGRGDV